MLTRTKVSNKVEKRILTGLIISTDFLRAVRDILQTDLLAISYSETVAEWCLEYFDNYGAAPGEEIQNIYEAAAPDLEEEEARAIEKFLAGLSDEYEHGDKFNVEYVKDQTVEWVKVQSLKQLSSNIKAYIANGSVEEAEAQLSKYVRVEHVTHEPTDPFTDKDKVHDAFETAVKPLMNLKGALGKFLNADLCRGSSIAIQAPAKSGKSFYLMELAFRAFRHRNNVAVFQVGDMSEPDFIERLHVRLAGRSNRPEYCGEVRIPKLNPEYGPNNRDVEPVIYEEDYIEEPLTWRQALRAGRKFVRSKPGRKFLISVHPADSISIAGIMGILDTWEDKYNFVPDVVVIDYMDLLAPEPGDNNKDERGRINGNWKAWRGMTLKRHILSIVATQSDIKGHEAETQESKHFSNDRRKFDHVTLMLGLNQTPTEKEQGIVRFNRMYRRKGECNPKACVKVLQCLQIGRPIIGSYF